MTNYEKKLWDAINQINGQIETARTYYQDFRLCDEPNFDTLEGKKLGAALTELIEYGAIARLSLREILGK